MINKTLVLILTVSFAAVGCGSAGVGDKATMTTSTTPAATTKPTPADGAAAFADSANPFYSPSSLYLQAPAFDRIYEADYLPAYREGMRQAKAEIRLIADNPEPATV